MLAHSATSPVQLCKSASQLPRDRTPVRPHVLHMLPFRYMEGDTDPVANGKFQLAWDVLGTSEQTTGEHQGSRLMDAQPVSFHETGPPDERTESGGYPVDRDSLPESPGEKVRLLLAIGEGGEHPAFAGRLSFQRVPLPLEVQSFDDNRLASILCIRDNGGLQHSPTSTTRGTPLDGLEMGGVGFMWPVRHQSWSWVVGNKKGVAHFRPPHPWDLETLAM